MRNVTELAIAVAERGAPDRLVRIGMRQAIRSRLASEARRNDTERAAMLARWHDGPIALVPDVANEQHYEVPADFFKLVLGPHMKYSSCLWHSDITDLAGAEKAMLELTTTRAGVENGMRILELGSGWGSLSLWLAERYPDSEVITVSNSVSQGDHVRQQAAERGLTNLRHRVVDVNSLDLDGPFDLVVSVEMLEHVRNHPALLQRLAALTTPAASLFAHVFSHRSLFWEFADRGPGDWMARLFFAGGVMPPHDEINRLLAPFAAAESWWVPGWHYAKTLEAWLRLLDEQRPAVERVLRPVYGDETALWIQRWRMFFMASSEFFGLRQGDSLGVSHHLIPLHSV